MHFLGLQVFLLREQLLLLQRGLARVNHDVAFVVEHPLDVPDAQVQQLSHPGGYALEVPYVGDRHRQLDVPQAFPADLGLRDLDLALVADHPAVPYPLVLAAVALPVLHRSEDPLAEEAVALGLEGPVVDGLRLRHLAVGPLPDGLRRGNPYLYCREFNWGLFPCIRRS
jgi:hypothetical protein